VEWYQDWPFGQATNDDLFMVGIALDDGASENGCLFMSPGSHRGRVGDHWKEARFTEAVMEQHLDPSSRAVAPAG